MTKREALRQTHQENVLLDLGFTSQEAESLRRISMTLRRWHELECGMDSCCLVRGTWNQETQAFDYDDAGAAYMEYTGGSGRSRYYRVPDRETGARKRLAGIIADRNDRACVKDSEGNLYPYVSDLVSAYIQTDPRGAALYIIRPGDVPEGKDVNSYYTRGVCIY